MALGRSVFFTRLRSCQLQTEIVHSDDRQLRIRQPEWLPMSANSRFAVAMHIMTALAYQSGTLVSSETLAMSVRTNAVVIRRILRQLAKAGLIVTQAGKGGGSQLARSAKQITLFDIYRAIDDDDPLFAIPEKPANQSCAVSTCMRDIATEVFAEAEEALARVLRKKKLSELVAEVP